MLVACRQQISYVSLPGSKDQTKNSANDKLLYAFISFSLFESSAVGATGGDNKTMRLNSTYLNDIGSDINFRSWVVTFHEVVN